MNISTQYNQPTFGMAFKKPSKEVLDHFENTMKYMNHNDRARFVKEMGVIVESAKGNPMPIEHSISPSKPQVYQATTGKITWSSQNNNAESILKTMRTAVAEADNMLNLRENRKAIENIFDIKA